MNIEEGKTRMNPVVELVWNWNYQYKLIVFILLLEICVCLFLCEFLSSMDFLALFSKTAS